MRILRNAGEIDIAVIKTMGINVKESSSPIGYFGTGLKYAIAVFLREEIDFRLFIGSNEYVFFTEKRTVRNKEFEFCMMRGPMDSMELGFTTELGKNWKLWQAYREIESNCRDEGGDVFDSDSISGCGGFTIFGIAAIDEMDTVFLREDEGKMLHSDDYIDVYEGQSEFVYYRGIRAKDIHDRPSMYTYNIKARCSLTEDRLICYDFEVERAIAKAVVSMGNKDLIREIISSKSKWFESSIDFDWDNDKKPSKQFMEAYGSTIKECSHSVRNYVTRNTPKPDPSPEMIAAKFREDLENVCSSFGVECVIDDRGNFSVLSEKLLGSFLEQTS